MDKNSCSVYAVAFACNVDPDRARYVLYEHGRELHEGADMQQILGSIKYLGKRYNKVKVKERTIRSFANACHLGTFLVVTADHVVTVVDGLICDRPKWSTLMRITEVYKIT